MTQARGVGRSWRRAPSQIVWPRHFCSIWSVNVISCDHCSLSSFWSISLFTFPPHESIILLHPLFKRCLSWALKRCFRRRQRIYTYTHASLCIRFSMNCDLRQPRANTFIPTNMGWFIIILIIFPYDMEAQSVRTIFVFTLKNKLFCFFTNFFSKWKLKLFERSGLPYYDNFYHIFLTTSNGKLIWI